MLHCNIEYATIRELAMLQILKKIFDKFVEARMKEADARIAQFKRDEYYGGY